MTESMMKKQDDGPPPPEWVVVGESVLIRPYNTSGVIGFVGPTHFQVKEDSFIKFVTSKCFNNHKLRHVEIKIKIM
jgi:hypothetical protein